MTVRQMPAILTFALLALATRADAHAFLLKSSPAVGSAVQTGVKVVLSALRWTW